MRGYWARIILGAATIGLVGFGVVTLVKRGVAAGHRVVETADPISIPLAFIPFNLDGQRVGSVKRLRILRDRPKSVTGFQIQVEVSELPTYEALSSGCVISVDNPTHLSTSTSFACGQADSSMVEFGTVQVTLAEGSSSRMSIPLYLPADVVAEFRGNATQVDQVPAEAFDAEAFARSMREMADSISRQTRVLADSLRRQAAARVPPP